MDKLLQINALYNLLELELFIFISTLVFGAWSFYKFFLRELSEERHRNLKRHHRNIFKYYIPMVAFFILFYCFNLFPEGLSDFIKLKIYIALITYFLGLFVFVRVARLLLLQYLFLGSMKAGVPILLVNIFSLFLFVVLVLWSASVVFGIQLAPLLTTSAVFSIILGLALQDTLGNIFAGISLQMDRSFEIGDWLEVANGNGPKIIGQVKEITWRSTVLVGWSFEIMYLPNRTMASSQISNFSSGDFPIIRSQSFKIGFRQNHEQVRQLLLKSCESLNSILRSPAPICFVSEISESWLNFKLIYYIQDYGQQFIVGDQVLEEALKALNEANIPIVPQSFQLIQKT